VTVYEEVFVCKDILKSDDLVERVLSDFEKGGATHVAGGMYDGGYAPVQSDLAPLPEPFVSPGPAGLLFLDRSKLSRGTIERILRKYGLKDVLSSRPKPEHYATRRAKRRDKYRRVERESKLRRDKWLKTTPDGLWYFYREYAKKRGLSWDIDFDDWMKVMYRELPDGRLIYEVLFFVERLDKSNKSYTLDSVAIVERYSKAVLYSTVVQ
jgi:hypothetical protein